MKKKYITPAVVNYAFMEPLNALCLSKKFGTEGISNESWSNKRDYNNDNANNPIWSNMCED